MNPRLRGAVQAARAQNMPNDKIERAIKKGTGELESQALEELIYEGYAPGGVALLIEAVTDNRNRSAADLRQIFSKHHGNLATSGSVAYLFHKKGQLAIPFAAFGAISAAAREDRMLELMLEAEAEEFLPEEEHYLVTTAPERLYSTGEALKNRGIPAENLKLTYFPETTVSVEEETTAAQILRLCDALEECDDVQNVHANFDFSEALLAKLSA